MNKLVRYSPREGEPIDDGERYEIPTELDGFPQSVREKFVLLPTEIQEKILPQIRDKSDTGEPVDTHKKVVDFVSGLDEKKREQFMSWCLSELFFQCKLRDRHDFNSEASTKDEILKIMDLLWANRGKGENVEIINANFYREFFTQREVLKESIDDQMKAISAQEKEIGFTKKQKRLTESKTQVLVDLQLELYRRQELLKKLYDRYSHDDLNSLTLPNMNFRQREEEKWTRGVCTTLEYCGPEEFAVAMQEALFQSTFIRENSMLHSPNQTYFGKPISPETLQSAKKLVEAVQTAVQQWADLHESETSFKHPREVKSSERQGKIIEYFRSLMDSYGRAKAENRNDEEMIYTIRQMEVVLTLLNQ